MNPHDTLCSGHGALGAGPLRMRGVSHAAPPTGFPCSIRLSSWRLPARIQSAQGGPRLPALLRPHPCSPTGMAAAMWQDGIEGGGVWSRGRQVPNAVPLPVHSTVRSSLSS